MADIKDILGAKKRMSNIFICIPTMNDFEYLSTIERAYDYADNPDNFSIGTTIFWKNKDISSKFVPFFYHIKNKLDKDFSKVKYDIQPWSLYPGIGRGRSEPTKYFNNEKYFMSIDSHTDFIDGWDTKLIDLYEGSRKSFGKKRVITSYLTPYKKNSVDSDYLNKNTDIGLRYQFDVSNRWQFFDFYKDLNDKDLTERKFPYPNDKSMNKESFKAIEKYLIDDEYVPAKKIAAHFYFTESDPWLTKYNLNLDRNIKFWAEELYQSALSYARGYNLVWIKSQVLFHMYGPSNGRHYENFYKTPISSDGEREGIYFEYIEKSSKINIDNLFKINDDQIIFDLFGIKSNKFGYLPRSLNGFLQYSGIDLLNKKTSEWWEVPKLNVVYR